MDTAARSRTSFRTVVLTRTEYCSACVSSRISGFLAWARQGRHNMFLIAGALVLRGLVDCRIQKCSSQCTFVLNPLFVHAWRFPQLLALESRSLSCNRMPPTSLLHLHVQFMCRAKASHKFSISFSPAKHYHGAHHLQVGDPFLHLCSRAVRLRKLLNLQKHSSSSVWTPNS